MRFMLVGLAAAAAVLGVSAKAADVVDGPRVHWNYSEWGKSRETTTAIENLGPWLEERTGGKFTVQVHWGTLSQPRAVLDGLKLGAFEGGSFCASYYPGRMEAHTGMDLPFLPISNLEQLRAVTDDYYTDDILKKEVAKWDSQYFMAALLPLYEVVGKGTPPKSLEDWDGMRIRALGPQGKAMQLLGAVPTSVPAPEVYTSMDRGLIDAAAFAYYAHDSYRTWELGDWFTHNLKFGSIACGALWNIHAYNALPPQYKALLEEFPDTPKGYEALIAALNEADKTVPGKFKENGLEEIEISAEERAEFEKMGGKPVWDEWAKKMTDVGYDGDRLLKLILDLSEKYKQLGS
jgi:TRAP-type C4-dicarboxylate transport system substrate-binding protein